MTLIEIMVAISIMTIVAFGTVSGLLQSRRLTERSIYDNTGATIAQGYIEQMMNMEFTLLDGSVIDQLFSQGAADSLTVSPSVADPETGDPATDIVNTKIIDINNTPGDTADDLEIKLVLYIDNLTDPNNGVGESRRIALRYSYKTISDPGKSVTYTEFNIRSRVATF